MHCYFRYLEWRIEASSFNVTYSNEYPNRTEASHLPMFARKAKSADARLELGDGYTEDGESEDRGSQTAMLRGSGASCSHLF